MKKTLLIMLCLIVMSTFALAGGLDIYISVTERYIDARARIVPVDDIDYDAELVFNFQNSSLLICEKDGSCYAWEKLSRKAMYSACKELLQNFSSYDDNISINIMQQGESNMHSISNADEAADYLELLSLAELD